MKKLKFVFMAMLALSAWSASCFGGNEGSGGGNALVCFDTPAIPTQIRTKDASGAIIDGSIRNEHIGHITSVEVLDLVEGQFKTGISQAKNQEIISLKPNETLEGYARRIIGRLKNITPQLHDTLMRMLNKMPEDSAIAQPDGLNPVNDYNLLGRLDSTNCVVGTMALHILNQNGNAATDFYYDPRLMLHPKHSELSKAITYLHEVVYSTARAYARHTDSQNTRKFIAAIIRKDLSIKELVLTLIRSDFDFATYLNSETPTGLKNFAWSGRFDRLGYVYAGFNYKAAHFLADFLLPSSSERKAFVEKYMSVKLAAPLAELRSFLPPNESSCINFEDCYYLIRRLSQEEKWKIKTKRAKAALVLVKKYEGHDDKIKLEAINEYNSQIDQTLKGKLQSFYEKNYRESLLSISNIDAEKLKSIDAFIEDTILNHFDKIRERFNKSYYVSPYISSDRGLTGSELFSDQDPNPIFDGIPMETKVP